MRHTDNPLSLTGALKTRIACGKVCIGSWVMLRDPISVEVLAVSGVDWLAIDMEHAPITLSECADMIRVGNGCGCPMLPRLPDHNPTLIKQVLDAGAAGVIVPDVRSVEQVERLAAAMRYPAAGFRGVGLARALGFGRKFNPYVQGWNGQAILVPQIEHIDAIDQVTQIAAHVAVDGVFIGPYDLSASMNLTGQLDHPKVEQSVEAIKAAAASAGKPFGIHAVAVDVAAAVARLRQGARFIAFASDVFMIRHAIDSFVAAVRSDFADC